MVVGLVLAGAIVARAGTPAEEAEKAMRREIAAKAVQARYCTFTNGCVQAFALAQSSDDAQIAQGFALYKDLLAKIRVTNPEWSTFLLQEMESRYESLGKLSEAKELAETMVEYVPNIGGRRWRGHDRLVWIEAKRAAGHLDEARLSNAQMLDAGYSVWKSHTNWSAQIMCDWILDAPPGEIRKEIYSLFRLDRVAKAAYPNSPALADRYGRYIREGIPAFQPQSIQDAFALLTINDPTIPDDAIKKYIMDQSLPLIRRTLRAQGKTFVAQMVVEGGKTNAVNPMQPFMDRISAALNAPYYKGLAEELMAIGAVIPNPPDWSAVAASVSAWQDKLMNDGEGLGSGWAGRAKSLLGVQGYNDFINVYNNGTGKPSK